MMFFLFQHGSIANDLLPENDPVLGSIFGRQHASSNDPSVTLCWLIRNILPTSCLLFRLQDFALGDFDDNPIAKLEEEKETEELAAASEHQQDAEQVADAEMLQLPGSSFTGSRKEKGKPLVEEL